jgi:membrane-bound serine protease (ClpP class)
MPLLPSTSTTSADSPARAAARASAAVTVVLPTPPFPATMNSRAVEQNRETSIRRRRLVTVLAATVAVLAVLAGAPAAAQQDAERIDVAVVEISGLLDRIQADFLRHTLTADANGTDQVVVRLDSSGSVLADDELRGLLDAVERAAMPVSIWIGPAKDARAGGDTALLLEAADTTSTTDEAPTLGDFIIDLDGIPTTVDSSGDTPRRQLAPNVHVRFAEPSFVAQLLHAVSTPSAAYLLLVVALLLLVFEFFTGGIGVAGAVAVVSLALSAYGLGALPTRPLALAALAIGGLGFAVDVQVGVPRAWTVIGTVLFTIGSFFLFAGGLRVPLLVLVAVLAAVLLFMVAAMPAVVRTRFSTPTIGRESMVGELGTATTDVAPDGLVTVRDAPWRARTNRATPIRAGDRVRVAAIDGLLLEVEPLEGAARDAGH